VSSASLEQLTAIVQEAGRLILRFYDEPEVSWKADASPITDADRAAHHYVVCALLAWDATIPIVSEEAEVPPFETRRQWHRFWLVDPLDGTREFIARNGEFTVNVALIEGGAPVLGVVHAPALRATYFAGAGLGAWRAGPDAGPTRLSGRAASRAVTRVVESRSHPDPKLDAFLSALGPVERIPLGSSLKFCRVAEGEADLYPRFGPTMEWDVAAGDCVYRHAVTGGVRPSPLVYNQPSLLIPQFVIGTLRDDAALHGDHKSWTISNS
jgi:3'(2'), 5'-bisphosphate nucleotidase